ncbi:MAG: outer membrane beta-barrel protein [Saprospiraceae bacterium]|nr:outer membrane beta-barrel protein [Saprospiraceae bacterium]
MKRILLYALMLMPLASFAQQKVELGFFGGFANYQGDLVENPIAISETKFSYGGFLRYHIDNKIKLRGNFMHAFISGSDANASGDLKDRGWSFDADLLEATLIGEFHPFGKERYGSTGIFERRISPYLGMGLGMVNFRPKVSVTNPDDAFLFPESNEKTTSLSIPIVVGMRADLFEFFSLGLEVGWRATFNDYLDGVSKNGRDDRNDWYVLAGFTASFFFGRVEPDYNFETN